MPALILQLLIVRRSTPASATSSHHIAQVPSTLLGMDWVVAGRYTAFAQLLNYAFDIEDMQAGFLACPYTGNRRSSTAGITSLAGGASFKGAPIPSNSSKWRGGRGRRGRAHHRKSCLCPSHGY